MMIKIFVLRKQLNSQLKIVLIPISVLVMKKMKKALKKQSKTKKDKKLMTKMKNFTKKNYAKRKKYNF